MSNFAQKTVVISFMTTKKYILAYFRGKSMDLGPKKYTSRIEVSRSTPDYMTTCDAAQHCLSLLDLHNTTQDTYMHAQSQMLVLLRTMKALLP